MTMQKNKLEILNMTVSVEVDMGDKTIIPKYFIEYMNSVYPFSDQCIRPNRDMHARKLGDKHFLHISFTSDVCPTLRSFEEYLTDFIFGDFFKIISTCGWKIQNYNFDVHFNNNFWLYEYDDIDLEDDEMTEIVILDSPEIGCVPHLMYMLYSIKSLEYTDTIIDEYTDFGKFRLKNIPVGKLEETKQLINLFGLKYEQ